MKQPMAQSLRDEWLPITVRLTTLQRRATRLLLIDGLATVILIGCGTALGLFALDWTFRFPSVIRFGFGLAWLASCAWLISRYVWLPQREGFSSLHVAGRVEERFPELGDRLSSAVSFIAADGSATEPLQRKLIERTEVIARRLPIEDVVTTRPVWWMSSATMGVVMVFAWLALTQPTWMGTGAVRLLLPFRPVEWPRAVEIRPLTTDFVIPVGESAVVSMEVNRGASHALRGYVSTQQDGGPAQSTVMRREGLSRYAATLNSPLRDVRYWFMAGDDSTADRPGTIRVVDRPAITDLRLTVMLPPYVLDDPLVVLPVGLQQIGLIEGSTLNLEFRCSKPLKSMDDGTVGAWVVGELGETAPVQPGDDPSGPYVAHLTPRRDGDYRIEVVDIDGLTNSGSPSLTISVRPDAPPTASILQPLGTLEVTAQATIAIRGMVRDDLGIDGVELTGVIRPANKPLTKRLSGWSPKRNRYGHMEAAVELEWTLNELAVRAGDRIEYALAAVDNRNTADWGPQSGRSSSLLLRVVSDSQLAAGAAEDLNRLLGRLRRALQQHEQLMADVGKLDQILEQSADHDADADLLRLSARQRSVVEQVEVIRRGAAALAQELAHNGIQAGREKDQAELLLARLKNIVEPALHESAVELNQARTLADREQQRRRLAQTQDRQRLAADAMRMLLDELSAWSDYNSVVANLRNLIDAQQSAARKTAEIQMDTLGRTLEELSVDVRSKLIETAQAQDKVTTGIERALGELDKLQVKLRASQPDEARAMEETARTLTSAQAVDRSGSAARLIRENRTAAAQTDQKKTEEALAEAIFELESRQQRKLAELSKKIADIETIIAHLLEEQRKTRDLTENFRPDGAGPTLAELGSRQRELRNNAAEAVATLDELADAGEAAQRARSATHAMSRASEALYDGQAQPAVQAQSEAIAHLEQVLGLLTALRERNEKTMEKAKLFALKQELSKIKTQQVEINAETDKILQEQRDSGRAGRGAIRRARRLAESQQELARRLASVQDKLADTPVYRWVVERIAQEMNDSASMLAEVKLEGALQRAQQRVLRLIDQLVDALKQVDSMIDEQFASGGGGGSGSAQLQDDRLKPVPTIAELIVLKGVQQELIQRTRELSESMNPENPGEEELGQVKRLGEEQEQLQALTLELTQKARTEE